MTSVSAPSKRLSAVLHKVARLARLQYEFSPSHINPYSSIGAKDGSGAKDGQGALKGLLSCIAGVGGVSVFIWVMFFVFLEPYDPSQLHAKVQFQYSIVHNVFAAKAVCTHVGSMDELRADVFAVVDPVGLNWQQFGSKLGLSAAQLEELTAAGDSIGESILRSVI